MFWHLPFTPIWPGNGMSQDSILSVSLFGLKINSVLKLYLLVLRVLSMWTILSFVTDLNIFISSKDTWADVNGFVQHIWNHSFSLMASRFLSLKKPNSWHNFWPYGYMVRVTWCFLNLGSILSLEHIKLDTSGGGMQAHHGKYLPTKDKVLH